MGARSMGKFSEFSAYCSNVLVKTAENPTFLVILPYFCGMTNYSESAPAKSKKSIVGNILKIIIPLVVSVGLCVVMFRDINFNDMVEVIRTGCNYRWIALMLLMSLIPNFLRAMRWRLQLSASGVEVPLRVLIYSIFGTYSVNLVFPRLGEVWRTGYVSYRSQSSFSVVLGSMIADRFADLVTVALLTLATFVVARGPLVAFISTYPQAYNAILAILSSPITWIVPVVLLAAGWWLLARSSNGFVVKVRNFLLGIWNGFVAIVRMQHKFQWLALTVALWGCYFFQLVVAFNAFSLTEQMLADNGLMVALVCFVLTSISMGIPSNGGIGPYQTTMLFGLALFVPQGVSHAEFLTVGAAFGNVIIASQTLMLIVTGIIVFSLIAIDRRRNPQH